VSWRSWGCACSPVSGAARGWLGAFGGSLHRCRPCVRPVESLLLTALGCSPSALALRLVVAIAFSCIPRSRPSRLAHQVGQPGCRLQPVATVPTSFDVTTFGLGSPACRGSQYPVVIGLSSHRPPLRGAARPQAPAPFCSSRPPGVDLHWFPSRVLPDACGFPATPLTARPPHPVRQRDSRRQSSASPPHGLEGRARCRSITT
jgi:hypothetical protein